MWTSENGRVQHIGKDQISGVNGRAADSFVAIHSRERLSHNRWIRPRFQVLSVGRAVPFGTDFRLFHADPSSFFNSAARRTALKIC